MSSRNKKSYSSNSLDKKNINNSLSVVLLKEIGKSLCLSNKSRIFIKKRKGIK